MNRATPIVLALSAVAASAQIPPPPFGAFPRNASNGGTPFVTTGNAELDTDEQSVFEFSAFIVNFGHVVTIKGERPAVIRVSGPVQIGGTLVLSGNAAGIFAAPGPGAGKGGSALQGAFGPRPGLASASGGGGGGGNVTAGEDGSAPATGGGFGACTVGSGGGAGSGGLLESGVGGGGGGMLTLLSDDNIMVSGSILANGGAGEGVEPGSSIQNPGGGGSGGRIVLGAPFVTLLAGTVEALGGAGGLPSGGKGGDGCVEIWSDNPFITPGVAKPEPGERGEVAYVDAQSPQTQFGMGFASTPAPGEIYMNFYSTTELANPMPIPGFDGELGIDTSDPFFNATGANTLAPFLNTNSGPLSFFTLMPVEVDVTPIVPLIESGAIGDFDLFVQPLGLRPGMPPRLGEVGTLHINSI